MTKVNNSIQKWLLRVLLPAVMPWYGAYGGIVPAKEDIVFIVDNSISMQQVDGRIALPVAIGTFVEGISRDVRAALILFHGNATLEVPFVSLTGDQVGDFLKGLKNIDYSDRFSNSAAAVERALYELQNSGRKGAGKSIILITSGRIDTGNEALDLNFTRWLTSVLAEDAASARIRIFCIAFSASGEVPELEAIARQSGGGFYRLQDASKLSAIFENVAGEIFFKPVDVFDEAPPESVTGSQ